MARLRGGEEGIRTLDTLITYTPLAGERLQPLGHLSAEPEPLINEQILGKRLLSLNDGFCCLGGAGHRETTQQKIENGSREFWRSTALSVQYTATNCIWLLVGHLVVVGGSMQKWHKLC